MSEVSQEAKSFLSLLKESTNTTVLTGAGVSVASGIPDFRSPGGLYSKVSPEIFELSSFMKDPAGYYKVARERIHTMADTLPNATHILLARLQELGLIQTIITQNIDGLLQKAGARDVVELHGTVSLFDCLQCSRKFDRSEMELILESADVPKCSCGGLIKPRIVFFGEMLPEKAIRSSEDAALAADLFLTLGSSLVVYPAAQFPVIAKSSGARVAIVNRDETGLDYLADHIFRVELEGFSKEVISLLEAES
ncbi:MAG: NAD-dependent protein deacetylase, SIR2 family [Mesotoga prima]|uniref:protein acetyllysine N-acetyltransferase n=1 Tax=Mesotoga prima TaxID=1184387 RepID=A0A101HP36_9BACT|nr:MAG: NAD-dependent protein deacetylase, SIR2 family [Mesotoga prima]